MKTLLIKVKNLLTKNNTATKRSVEYVNYCIMCQQAGKDFVSKTEYFKPF